MQGGHHLECSEGTGSHPTCQEELLTLSGRLNLDGLCPSKSHALHGFHSIHILQDWVDDCCGVNVDFLNRQFNIPTLSSLQDCMDDSWGKITALAG